MQGVLPQDRDARTNATFSEWDSTNIDELPDDHDKMAAKMTK